MVFGTATELSVRVELLDGEGYGNVAIALSAAILEPMVAAVALVAAEGAVDGLEYGGHEIVAAIAADDDVVVGPPVAKRLVDVLGDLVHEQLAHVGLHGDPSPD